MSSHIDFALKVAWALYGTRYTWGGDDPIGGTDCSGFTSEILRSIGEIGPRDRVTTHMLWQNYNARSVPETKPIEPGDILLFSRDGKVAGINHTGIAVGNGLMLEAGGGMQGTDTDAEAAAQNAFVRLRPIDGRGLFAVLRIID